MTLSPLTGLPPLVSIMQNGTGTASSAALAALTNIAPSIHPPRHSEVVLPVVDVILDPRAPQRKKQEAVAALRNLSGTDTVNADLIVSEGRRTQGNSNPNSNSTGLWKVG